MKLIKNSKHERRIILEVSRGKKYNYEVCEHFSFRRDFKIQYSSVISAEKPYEIFPALFLFCFEGKRAIEKLCKNQFIF